MSLNNKADLESHKDEILDKLDEAIPVALESCGLAAERHAKFLCPVDTGRLRNSITYAVSGQQINKTYRATFGSNRTKNGNRVRATSKNAGDVATGSYAGSIGVKEDYAVYIGTNVEYAPYVELGARKRRPRPFLKPAITDHISQYNKIIETTLRNF